MDPKELCAFDLYVDEYTLCIVWKDSRLGCGVYKFYRWGVLWYTLIFVISFLFLFFLFFPFCFCPNSKYLFLNFSLLFLLVLLSIS